MFALSSPSVLVCAQAQLGHGLAKACVELQLAMGGGGGGGTAGPLFDMVHQVSAANPGPRGVKKWLTVSVCSVKQGHSWRKLIECTPSSDLSCPGCPF